MIVDWYTIADDYGEDGVESSLKNRSRRLRAEMIRISSRSFPCESDHLAKADAPNGGNGDVDAPTSVQPYWITGSLALVIASFLAFPQASKYLSEPSRPATC